jgi:AcrR family transcriptional regulator
VPVWKSGSNFDAFHALDADKQTRIINAALAEFTTKGFKRASTNIIAENAQIGKGMLFYYFGSKQELFDFLFQYTVEFARNEYFRRFDCISGDFLERYKSLTDIKRNAMNKFPAVIGFFESFYREENAQYFERYASVIAEIRQAVYGKIYEGIDYSLFRQDLDGKTVVKYLKWLFDAYEAEITARLKLGDFDVNDEQSLASEWSRFDKFTSDMRKVYYKEDYSNGSH